MAKRISAKWKALDEESRRPFVEQAKVEKEQYTREVAKYKARKAQEAKEAQAKQQQVAGTEAQHDMSAMATTIKPTKVEEVGPKTKKVKTAETRKVESAITTTSTTMPKRPSSLDEINDQMEDFLCIVEPASVSPGTSDDDDEEGPVATSAEQDPFHIDIEEVDANDLLGILDAAIAREGDMVLPTNPAGTTKSLPPKKAIARRRSSLLMMMEEEPTAMSSNTSKPGIPKVVSTANNTTGSNLIMPGMPTIPPGVDTLRFMEGCLHQQQLQIARNNDILRKARMTAMMANTNAGVRATAAAKNIKAKIDISVTPV